MNDNPDKPRRLSKDEFGRKLHEFLVKKDWSQAELGRRAGVPKDSISSYINGQNFPSPRSLEKIAKVLRIDANDLLPNYAERKSQMIDSGLEVRDIPGDPTRRWLRVNRMVSNTTATEIQRLIDLDVNALKRG